MQRRQIAIAAIASILLSSVAFTGCKDDDDDAKSVALAEGTASSVSLTRGGDLVSIPVVANGEWTASISNEEADWLGLVTTKGSGDGTIDVVVEPNATEGNRSASIIITNGEQTLTYSIEQSNLPGEDVDENAIDFGKFDKTLPLGWGCRLKARATSTPFLTTSVFLLKESNWKSYVAKNKDFNPKEYVSESNIPSRNIKLSTAEQFANENKGLSANLKLTIKYALFKFGLEGGFKLASSSTDTTYSYTAASVVPSATMDLDFASFINDIQNIEVAEGAKDPRLYFMAPAFIQYRDKIFAAVKSGDDAAAKKLIKSMDDKFGPVFISKVETGGDLDLGISLKKSSSSDTTAINGELTASFSGLFSIDGSAKAKYLSTINSYMSETEANIRVTGGDNAKINALMGAVTDIINPMNKSGENTTKLLNAMEDWASSLAPGNVLVTDYKSEPIWELFVNEDIEVEDKAKQAIKDYMKETYTYSGTECPYAIDIKALAEE